MTFRDKVETRNSIRDEIHDFVKWGGIILLKAKHILILSESQKCTGVQLLTSRRNPERAGSILQTPLPTPSMHSPPFPPVCRGEVSWDVPWSWLLVSSPRMLARMVSRKMSRAAERQSLLMFVTLQKGIYGKTGVHRSVYTPADGQEQVRRRGVRK